MGSYMEQQNEPGQALHHRGPGDDLQFEEGFVPDQAKDRASQQRRCWESPLSSLNAFQGVSPTGSARARG